MSPRKRERCDATRTELPGGRHASNNDRPRTSNGDACESIGSMTTAIRGHVYDLQHTHSLCQLGPTYCLRLPLSHYTPPYYKLCTYLVFLSWRLAQVLHPFEPCTTGSLYNIVSATLVPSPTTLRKGQSGKFWNISWLCWIRIILGVTCFSSRSQTNRGYKNESIMWQVVLAQSSLVHYVTFLHPVWCTGFQIYVELCGLLKIQLLIVVTWQQLLRMCSGYKMVIDCSLWLQTLALGTRVCISVGAY